MDRTREGERREMIMLPQIPTVCNIVWRFFQNYKHVILTSLKGHSGSNSGGRWYGFTRDLLLNGAGGNSSEMKLFTFEL